MSLIRNATVLSSKRHLDLRLSSVSTYTFAKEEMHVPIMYSEMSDIAREYPLLFLKDHSLPVALLGVEKGVNAYVDENGNWLASYIPGIIRVYPFQVAAMKDKSNEMAVVFDAASEQLSTTVGLPLFDQAGQAQKVLKARIDVLRKMKEQETKTIRMVEELRSAELLVERAIRISPAESDDRKLTGVEFVNEQAFNDLSLDAFSKLRDAGVLPLIYAHLLSVANLRQGIITRKYTDKSKPDMGVSMVDLDRFLAQSDAKETVVSKGVADSSLDLNWLSDSGDIDLSDLSTITKKKDMH